MHVSPKFMVLLNAEVVVAKVSLLVAVMLALGLSSVMAATTFRVIARFPGGNGGAQPEGGVIVDSSDGRSLYGTTDKGGAGSSNGGLIYMLVPPETSGGAWTKRILFDFPGAEGGAYPLQLIPDGSGGLFGYTLDGGSAGYGTVFRATPKANSATRWSVTPLYDFKSGQDGAFPSGLTRAGGQVYGVTDQGGTGGCTSPFGDVTNCGTVFQLIPPASAGGSWTEKVIYAFKGGADGATPNGDLLVRGNSIIGTTTRGGGGSCTYNGEGVGCGVLYQLTAPAGGFGKWTFTVLYSFAGGADGAQPADGVISDGGNGFIGVTSGGGNKDTNGLELGTVYRLVRTEAGWQHRVIYRFTGGARGYEPLGGLAYDPAKGTLYGTTYLGGVSSGGTAFQLDKTPAGPWRQTVIHSFTGGADGSNPSSALVMDSAGTLYGTTIFGNHGGATYQISVMP